MVSFFPHRLTAFVLRSFVQARPFIFVDLDELKDTQDWITKIKTHKVDASENLEVLFTSVSRFLLFLHFLLSSIFNFSAFFHFMCCKCWIPLANLTLPCFRVVFQMKQRLQHLSQCPFWNPGCLLRYY